MIAQDLNFLRRVITGGKGWGVRLQAESQVEIITVSDTNLSTTKESHSGSQQSEVNNRYIFFNIRGTVCKELVPSLLNRCLEEIEGERAA